MTPEDREEYWKRHEEIKRNGVPFYPYAMYKDALMGLIVFLAVVFLAVVVGVPSEPRADPTDTAYVPRPEWYFLSLYELLKYLPGQLEWVGVLVVPGVLALVALALPFFDRSKRRHPLDRPVATSIMALLVLGVAALGIKGAFTPAPPTAQAVAIVEPAGQLSALARSGREVFQQQNCATCHTVKGVGGQLGPDLTTIGQQLSASWLLSHLENPTPPMPSIHLSNDELMSLTAYLLSLKSVETAVPPNPPLEPAMPAGGVAPSVAPEATAGKAKFDQACGGCHPNGKAGLGPAVYGPQFDGRFGSDDLIVEQVRNPKGSMPAFTAQQLSDDDLSGIIAYIRSLK